LQDWPIQGALLIRFSLGTIAAEGWPEVICKSPLPRLNTSHRKTDKGIKMKKFITLMTSCSLALAAVALGQQTTEPAQAQSTPTTSTSTEAAGGKSQGATEATTPAQSKRQQRHQARQEAKSGGQDNASATGESASQEQTGKHRGRNRGNANASENNAAGNANAGASASPSSTDTANANAGDKKHGKDHKGRNARNEANATATPNVTGTGAAGAGAATGAAGANASPSATASTQTNTATTTASPNTAATTNTANAGGGRRGKKVDPQTVQTIKSQHASFRAQPRPDKVPAVSFSQNYRINGADQWQGEKYSVYRSYHPEMHDRNWYHQHYQRVELIGGGYYYFNNGYWFPAWGYDQSAQYYAYDAPIYVGSRAEPPDRVIADVQAVLQQEGYYTGEVDGLLGPLTRQALTDYQKDNGLYTTAVIDEPTLQSLNMSS
jgi:hypothetical protein